MSNLTITSDQYVILTTKDGHQVTVSCNYVTFAATSWQDREWAAANGFQEAYGGFKGKHFYKPFPRGKFGQIRVGGSIFTLRDYQKGNPCTASKGVLSFKRAEYAQVEWFDGMKSRDCLNP